RVLPIPTRRRTEAWLVSTVAARSSLVTTLAGWCPAKARIRVPGGPSVSRIGGLPFPCLPRASFGSFWLQPDQGLSGVDRVLVLDQPLDDGAGERGGDGVLPAPYLDVPERGARGDGGACRQCLARMARLRRPEGAVLRGDQQPPLGQMAVLVRARRAVLGDQRARGGEIVRWLQR